MYPSTCFYNLNYLAFWRQTGASKPLGCHTYLLKAPKRRLEPAALSGSLTALNAVDVLPGMLGHTEYQASKC